ncbi:MAG: GNAT family N-acetyltransferase [Pseudomonadota bacterium]
MDAGLDHLETARLTLRRFTLEDEPLMFALNSDANVMRHLGGPMGAEANRAMLEGRILRYYEEHPGLGVWATCLRDTGRCVGFHLLNHVQGESLIQVGYRLFEADWGKGYATEMSVALLRYGFTRLGLPMLMANAALENKASQHALLKSGLHRQGERAFSHPAYAAFGPMAYFERHGADWLAEFGRG